jgi:hypothetical protein
MFFFPQNRHRVWISGLLQREHIFIVGVAGFEPAIFCSQSSRPTKLGHTPLFLVLMGRPRIPTISYL